MLLRDDLGRDEGDEVGPEPGKGAVVFTCTGEADFDGSPGDALPPVRGTPEPALIESFAEAVQVSTTGQMI